MNTSLVFVQRIITSYRAPIFEEIYSEWSSKFAVCADLPGSDFGDVNTKGFRVIRAEWVKVFYFHFMSFKALKECLGFGRVIHVADFKFTSLWILLFISVFSSKRKIWMHGQGGYKQKGWMQKVVYSFTIWLSDGYIAYSELSAREVKKRIPKFLHGKVFIVDNTAYLEPVSPNLNIVKLDKIIYIGRVRPRCGIELLLECCEKTNVELNVIGQGDEKYIEALMNKYKSAKFHGAIYDSERVSIIAKHCFAGAYGGDAGLSVVHYMALGLPVIVHDDLYSHMGPEPSYVINHHNGLTFEKGSASSLSKAISSLKVNHSLRKTMAINAHETFVRLSVPTMGYKFLEIVKNS